MSVKHTAWVWEHSRAEGGALLVALALADSINHLDGSDECWPKREILARRVRLSPSQVSRHLGELEKLGEIERRRTRNGNHYRMLLSDVRICDERTGATSDDAPTLFPDDAPVQHPHVEPEVGTGKEPELVSEVFAEWLSLSGQTEAHLSPARQRQIRRLLSEEPDVEILKRALRGYAAHVKRTGRSEKRWEISDAFSTFKGRDAESKPVFGDLRSRINWLLSVDTSDNSQRSVEEIERRMEQVGLDPVKGLRWLEDVRYHRGKPRAEEARQRLEGYGFRVINLDGRPFARLDW